MIAAIKGLQGMCVGVRASRARPACPSAAFPQARGQEASATCGALQPNRLTLPVTRQSNADPRLPRSPGRWA